MPVVVGVAAPDVVVVGVVCAPVASPSPPRRLFLSSKRLAWIKALLAMARKLSCVILCRDIHKSVYRIYI